MDGTTAPDAPRGHALWAKVLGGLALLAVLLVLLAIFFPWDVLRGPLNRYVSDRTGRHFEITRRLDVKLGRTTRIIADGIVFANPDWAKDPQLVKAEGAEIDIELLPLLRRRIVLPRIAFREPQLGLQMEADGRRSWALGRDTKDPGNLPDIGAVVVDHGSAHFVATEHGADIHTEFSIDGPMRTTATAPAGASSASGGEGSPVSVAAMPLRFSAKGTWQKEPFTAQGHTGNVLYLRALQQPFPMEVEATAAHTSLRASGSIRSLATMEGADARFKIDGNDLQELYKLLGMVLPATPRYSLQGHVSREGDVWHIRQIDGKLGASDLRGELAFDRGQPVPLLTGKLETKSLDFADLAPLVGLSGEARSAAVPAQAKGSRGQTVRAAAATPAADRRVLPTAPLDVERIRRMNADVSYNAARISNVKQLPLERVTVRVRLQDGVLQLDPLTVGVAGGTFAGRLRINGTSDPAVAEVHLDARALELAKLFPGAKLTKTSLGKIHGDVDLKGRGNSVAQMLGTSSGSVAMLMGRGQISNLLLEIAGIDGGEIIKFFLEGDRNVELRCAAAAFDVKDGLMKSQAMVLDTSDTVIYGTGDISLRNEAMDLTLRPYPKDMSILSLRSPLKVAGTFASPKAGPDKGALAGRAGIALALGAINPLLALAATVETGPGEDANCGPALRDASSAYQAAKMAVMTEQGRKAEQDQQKEPSLLGRLLGGPSGASAGKQETRKDQAPATAQSAAPAAAATSRPHAPGAPGKPYGP